MTSQAAGKIFSPEEKRIKKYQLVTQIWSYLTDSNLGSEKLEQLVMALNTALAINTNTPIGGICSVICYQSFPISVGTTKVNKTNWPLVSFSCKHTARGSFETWLCGTCQDEYALPYQLEIYWKPLNTFIQTCSSSPYSVHIREALL